MASSRAALFLSLSTPHLSAVFTEKKPRRAMRAPPPPRRHVALFLFFLVALGTAASSCQAQKLVQHEIDALRQIASKLNKKWDFSVDPCSQTPGWVDPQVSLYANSVTCDCNLTMGVCHVVNITLKGQNLTGVLPDEFSILTFLYSIDLTRNYLNGTIPTSWATLPLTNLTLLGNRISGSIPKELGNMITLQSLVLESNQLQGPIPSALGNLANLNRFLAGGNNFSGELPESLGKLKNMTDFRVDGSPISGKFPSFIGNWTKLQRLDMQGTSLEGPFPTTLATLGSITELRLSDTKLGNGEFPPLQNMKSMVKLVLRNLSISGSFPEFIEGMTALERLDLSFNNLTGPIPDSEGLASINYLYLTNNNLNGIIPNWILTSKHDLDLSYNNFTGPSTVHDCQQNSVSLVSIYSSIDSSTINTCLWRNFPCSGKAKNYKLFINCGGSKVTIDGNDYEDDTFQYGPSTYLISESRKWAYTSTGDFLDNDKGKYITTNASILNMTNPELYMNARLSPLSLRYYGLCLQRGNYSVTLHFSEIMLTSDETYSSVGRRLFDVYIQGKKVLQDFNIAKEAKGAGNEILGNFTALVEDGTLEIHFQWTGKGTNSIPHKGVYGPLISAISITPNFKPDMGKLSVGAILGIVAASCFVIMATCVLCWFCCRRKDDTNKELRGLELQTGYFTLKQIKAATNNFDPANKIGEGGFGPVYRGVLSDGSIIAVKQLSSKSKQGNREFVNEIGMISALQHPNLVKLFGCCVEGSQLLVIYEYMENNSLARALFGPERDRLKLAWQTRCRICLGIARGLAYLHEESRLKIVHRDIKATNILLNKDLNAKISDFGLAKLDEEENTHISTRIAGTIGYMAPEYATRGYLTDKADVYSFGVVVLEIVSGMSNTNYRPKEECVYLLDWAYVLQEQGSLLELVDPNLGSNYSKEEATQMLNLALICTNPSPTLRPQMSIVVSMLEGTTPVGKAPAPARTPAQKSEDMRFKALEKISHDSQTRSISSTDGPWVDTSDSFQSSQTGISTTYSTTSKLLSEHTQ